MCWHRGVHRQPHHRQVEEEPVVDVNDAVVCVVMFDVDDDGYLTAYDAVDLNRQREGKTWGRTVDGAEEMRHGMRMSSMGRLQRYGVTRHGMRMQVRKRKIEVKMKREAREGLPEEAS
jgi:hypothetical protein